ncbi:hypothetical protein GE107_03605 [Cohnella sp. CFH 77786]|uniref:hypothetical protein n=1 Tax=Cohnella sp. CFH 77786 TaxID=2662265 RepID=UPI001C60E040|nr:hypothetical protein [Cohnella sp. CFH 77786]MBW5445149.1 hypothetical protein [Cohnella sp. CFH 77786]
MASDAILGATGLDPDYNARDSLIDNVINTAIGIGIGFVAVTVFSASAPVALGAGLLYGVGYSAVSAGRKLGGIVFFNELVVI